MRIIVLLYSITILIACHNEAEKTLPPGNRPKKDSKYAGFLAKCKPVTIDTFWVHYDESLDDTLGISDSYPFKGVLLDSAEAALFPSEVLTGSMGTSGGMYACYCFAIDEGRTGIIARTPSMYQSLSIKLFTLDNMQDTLTDFIELATFEGDGGESAEKTSWLYRDHRMNLNAFVWELNTYDHRMDGGDDTTVDRTNSYYVLDLSKPKYDTINRNGGALLKTFQAVTRN